MKRSRHNQGCQRNRRNGAALVESAFVLSVLLLVLFAMLDLSLTTLARNSLEEAARRVTREAIVRGENAPPERTAWGPATVTTTGDASTEVAALARKALTPSDLENVQIVVEWIDGENTVGDRVRVTVSYTYQPAVPFLLGSSNYPISARSTMRITH